MSLRVLEIIVLILYWVVIVPIIVLIMRESKFIWNVDDYIESFKLYFIFALGLSTLFWILYLLIICVYVCLARSCSREDESQSIGEPVELNHAPVATLNRQPAETIVTVVTPTSTPHRPAPSMPRGKSEKQFREFDLPPSYQEVVDDTPNIEGKHHLDYSATQGAASVCFIK